MKSAYEIAMEKLEKDSGPLQKLSDEQKACITEIEKKYEARIAEQKLVFESRINGATTIEEQQTAQTERAEALTNLEDARDKEKEAVWQDE